MEQEYVGVSLEKLLTSGGPVSYTHLHNMYKKTRSEGFGPEVKRRIMLGSFVLSSGYYDAYYLKALRTKALIKKEFDRAFRN